MSQKTAFLFPGQGAQYVGMAADLAQALPQARDKFEQTREILGYDLGEFCFAGPEDRLKQTNVTQPAIFVHSCIVLDELLARGLRPDMTAGHSLGEYTALVAAGVLDFAAALALVKVRANAMQQAGEKRPGTMAAVLGLEMETVSRICEEASTVGVVQAANENAPGQVVISGSHEGIAKAVELAKVAGARRAMELVVGGAFHSPLMSDAADDLRKALQATEFADARVPIYQNVHGRPETEGAAIRENLDLQLTSPVRWVACMQNIVKDGGTNGVEVGPGRVLSGLARRIDRSVEMRSFDKLTEITELGEV